MTSAAATPPPRPTAVASAVVPECRARFRRRRRGSWTILSAAGDLDATATGELRRQLSLALADSLYLIVDVSRARLIDDAAAELLVGMDNRLRSLGGRLSTVAAAR